MRCQKSNLFEQVRNRRFRTRAQGISINTIIIAALALIVLVVLIAIFTGRLGIWGQELDKQQNKKCVSDIQGTVTLAQDCVPPKQIVFGKFSDVSSGQVCCKG